MTQSETVIGYYRFVLEKLKTISDTSPSNQPLRYELGHVISPGVPGNETEENIVRKLAELGAVRILREFPRTWEYKHNGYFELQIMQPDFDNFCKKYSVIDDTPDESNAKTPVNKVRFVEIEDLPEDTIKTCWWVLKRIKKEFLATGDNEDVLFKPVPGEVIFPGKQRTVPDVEDQKLTLRLFQRMGTIKIKGETTKGHYILEVLRPRFDEIYERYEEINRPSEPKSDEVKNLPQKIESPEIIRADLEDMFAHIESETNDHMFYLRIAAYGKYLVEHPQLNIILKDLYEDSKRDGADFIKKWSDFFDIWKSLSRDLVELAKKEGVKGNPSILYQDLAKLKQRLSQPDLSFWAGDIYSYYIPFRGVIDSFVQQGKTKLMVPKYLDKGGVKLSIDPEYRAATNAWEVYSRLRQIRPWWAHYQVMRLTGGALDLPGLAAYFKEDNEVDQLYKYEFGKVGSDRSFIFLKRGKFTEWIKTLHNYIVPRISQHVTAPSKMATSEIEIPITEKIAKLNFYPDDELAEYKEVTKKVKGKVRALLSYLNQNKNTPYSVSEIALKCNPLIRISFHHFRRDKDIYDTVEYLKEILKVKKSEYFPIHKIEDNWIWVQK